MFKKSDIGDVQSVLRQEIDAWLAGDGSRRHFLKRAVQLGGLAALPASVFAPAIARAQVQLADPSTPLGQAQAAAYAAATEGPADNSTYKAVQAAKQYSGTTISMTYEAGLQALEPRNYSGPLWQELTGIQSNVVELPPPDLYSKAVAENFAGSGAYDVLDVMPSWIPSLVEGGVIAPIDDYIAQHGNPADQDDFHPLYRSMATYKGRTYGFFDDGDVFALYYRKDIFEDQALRDAYQAQFGRELRVPENWDEYAETAQFITDQMAPDVYGAAHFRQAANPGNYFDFYQRFRNNGGVFFDEATMRAQLGSEAGLRTLQQMIAANNASMPGNNEMGAVAVWAAFLQGKLAMIYSWPPSGRMSAGYSQSDAAINFVPQSTIAGKVGYALVPGKNGQHAAGFAKCLATGSANPEAAYLTMQFQTSPAISLVRVMVPYALRDPYRLSHFSSPLYGALWPDAKGYLANLNNAANYAVIDLTMPGASDYNVSIDRMCTSVWAGTDPAQALQTATAEWDAITDRLGVEPQKAAYQEFVKYPGAYASNTVAELGQGVTMEQ